MQLQVTNTLSNKLEVFEPINNKNIKIYVCGPTVYDNPHIGNGRALVVYDILYRVLIALYGKEKITFVRNITDVDDKIIVRANELNISIQELTDKVTKSFHSDCTYLFCLKPTHEPKATEHILEMISIIERLIGRGHAYVSNDHVYFSARSCKDYAKLAGREIESLIVGARIEVDKNKRHPEDFVLWKPKGAENVESCFDSPWGIGRPGWHIECSAMSFKYLGTDFDIHGGGADLKFPHHTNEIAQSTCAFDDAKFAKYWIHNGFLTVGGEKMSKSLGNFVTICELRERGVKGEALRLLLLNASYKAPLDYSEKAINDAKENLDYLYRSVEDFVENYQEIEFKKLPDEFTSEILKDLNFHNAFTFIILKAQELNRTKKQDIANIIISSLKFLGFLNESSDEWFGRNENESEIIKLIEARKLSKHNKNWIDADRIRDLLLEKNIILEDKPDGSVVWRKK